MKHPTWMLIACLLPIVLLSSLSSAGIQSSAVLGLLLAGCFVLHLAMMKGLDHGGHDGKKERRRLDDGS